VPRRSLAVLVAVAVAAVASFGAYLGLHSAQTSSSEQASLTSVYVLKGTVPRAESAAEAYAFGLIRTTRLPRQLVPAGAVTRLSDIEHQVAQYDLPAGQVVVAAMFVPQASLHSVAAGEVPTGRVAVTVSVSPSQGVADLVQPGDRVDIFVDIDGTQESYLYQSVPVLAVNTELVHSRSATSPPSLGAQTRINITFAVPPVEATQIAAADSGHGGVTGGLYLALDRPGTTSHAIPAITTGNLVPGSLPIGAPVPGVVPGSVSSGQHVQNTDNDVDHP